MADRSEYVPAVGGFLASPVVGGIAGLVFHNEKCTTIPGTTEGLFPTDPQRICNPEWNSEIGVYLTLIGWAISGIWLAFVIFMEQTQG